MLAAVGRVSWPKESESSGTITSGDKLAGCAEPLVFELFGAANAVQGSAARTQAVADIPGSNHGVRDITFFPNERNYAGGGYRRGYWVS